MFKIVIFLFSIAVSKMAFGQTVTNKNEIENYKEAILLSLEENGMTKCVPSEVWELAGLYFYLPNFVKKSNTVTKATGNDGAGILLNFFEDPKNPQIKQELLKFTFILDSSNSSVVETKFEQLTYRKVNHGTIEKPDVREEFVSDGKGKCIKYFAN
jgi:hypothetical protein